ncbi:MAG: bacteriohemerythrin [Alphaproteobacteria bacterium]
MPIATWRDSMNLNYPPLDDEHKAFLNVVNQAYMASQVDDFEMMDRVFEKCYDYARNHFSHEEDIMERIQFPDIENHMKSHQVFIHNVSEMRQQYEVAPSMEDKRRVSIKLANFLNVWLLGHILSKDKVLKPFLVRLRNLPPRMNF